MLDGIDSGKPVDPQEQVKKQKFDPNSDEVIQSVFTEFIKQGKSFEDINIDDLVKAKLYATDFYYNNDDNQNGTFEVSEIEGNIRNYANQKDGEFKATSFTDLIMNIYNKAIGNNPKTGERVETSYQGDTGEVKEYFDADNRKYQREYRENGVLVSKFEYPNEKAEYYTGYEADGKTIKETATTIKDGNKETKISYDKNGKVTGASVSVDEVNEDGIKVHTYKTIDAAGKITSKIMQFTTKDGIPVYQEYDGNDKLIQETKMLKDKEGHPYKLVTDGEGNIIEKK